MKFLNLIIITLLLLIVQLSQAQIPRTLSFQGVLTDATGQKVSDNNYNLTFKLYDVDKGGTALWQETQTVPVSEGIFNVILGNNTSLNLNFDKQYWLGITIDSGSELAPRIKLTSSAYSLNARSVIGEGNVFPSEGNVGIGNMQPQKPLDVAAKGGIQISQTDTASMDNELFFLDNGQIRSADDNHRIIFERENNILELREWGKIIFSPGAVTGKRTQKVTFDSQGNVGIGEKNPSEKLQVKGLIHTTEGGFKFPDGTIQTTAATGGNGG